MYTIFWWGNLKGRGHSGDQGVNGITILNIRMGLRAIGWEGVDWIHLAQDRDRWRTLVTRHKHTLAFHYA